MTAITRFNIECKECGSKDIYLSVLPHSVEISVDCGNCGNQELFDSNLDYDIDSFEEVD